MGLFEDDVLQEGDGVDVLLLHGAIGLLLLTYHDAGCLRLEEDATGGDVGSTAVLEFDDTNRGESHLEDADTVEADLLTHLKEVLHGTAEFVEDGLDV